MILFLSFDKPHHKKMAPPAGLEQAPIFGVFKCFVCNLCVYSSFKTTEKTTAQPQLMTDVFCGTKRIVQVIQCSF